MKYEYRDDGWPLCPRCGEDELMSVAPLKSMQAGGETVSLRTAQATDPMACLSCHWRGSVPAMTVQ